MNATADSTPVGPDRADALEWLEEYRRAANDAKESSDDIQVRANAILGFTAVILSLTLGIDYPTILSHGDFGIPAIVVLLATMAAGVLAVMLPECESVDSKFLVNASAPSLGTLLQKHATLKTTNASNLKWKRRLLNFTILLLTIGVLLLVLSIVQSGVSFPAP